MNFVKDCAAAGLNRTIPLYGPGFLTDGTLEAQGTAAQGIVTALHYPDNPNTPRDNAFRLAFARMCKTALRRHTLAQKCPCECCH